MTKIHFFNQPYVLYWGNNPIYDSSMFYKTHTIGAGTEWNEEPVKPPKAIIIATKEYYFGNKANICK